MLPQRGGKETKLVVGGNTIRTTTFSLNYYLKGEDIKFMIDYLDGRVPGSSTDGGRILTRVQVIY